MAHLAGHITEALDLGAIDARHRGEVLHVWTDGPNLQTLKLHLNRMCACFELLGAAPWTAATQGKLALWLCDAWGMDLSELDTFAVRFGPFVYLEAARRSGAMLVRRVNETLADVSLALQMGRRGHD